MPKEFRCPNCREMIVVENGKGGEDVKCPFCDRSITAILHETPTPSPRKPGEEPAPARLGDYEIIETLGEGGMGVVHKARNLRLDRTVALKVLPQRFTRPGSEYLERFLREARAAAQLDHPNVVAIHAVGEAEGKHFIEMQYVEGKTLAQVLAKQRRLPVDEAIRIVKEAARALDAAHGKGIVHRDIKPDNIMIAADGAVKVMDFGLARSEAASAITSDGQVIGTPHYMSPEQCDGKPSDRRSDIYSLGATLYRALSGRPLFSGETPLTVMRQHSDKEPPPLKKTAPHVPDAVCAIVHKMLQKDPDKRFQSCEEFILEIEEAHRPPRTEEEDFRKTGWFQIILALAAILCIGGLVLYSWIVGDYDAVEEGRPPTAAVSDSRFPSSAACAFAANLIGQRRSSLSARTLSVAKAGAEYQTISKALANAKPGDAVEIRDSETYCEEVVIDKPNIHLKATPQQTPTIDAEKRRPRCIAVEAGGSGAVIEGIRCVGATNDGILVSAGADDVILCGNMCSDNRWGIRVKGNRAIIIANRSMENESYGIQLWASQGSKVADNGSEGNSSGIDVNQCRNSVIAGNIVHAGRKSGMQCRDSEAVVVNGNIFHECEGDAIDLDTSKDVEIFNNIIAQCRGAGISFGQQCERTKAHHNDVFGCKTYGRRERKWFKDIETWKKETGLGQGSLSVDPAFNDPPSDFSLRDDSPCRGKGADGLDLGVLWMKSGLER